MEKKTMLEQIIDSLILEAQKLKSKQLLHLFKKVSLIRNEDLATAFPEDCDTILFAPLSESRTAVVFSKHPILDSQIDEASQWKVQPAWAFSLEHFITFITSHEPGMLSHLVINRLKQYRNEGKPTPIVQAKKSVLVFDSKHFTEQSFSTSDQANEFSFEYVSSRLTLQTSVLAKGFETICCFVNDDLSAPVLEALHRVGVRLIVLRCAGFNKLDVQKCKDLDIKVARVPAYSPHAVAEHAVALLLCLNRKIHLATQRIMTANFLLDGLVGRDLYGKTVGIIGYGKIGRCFSNIMLGFGCKVLVFDPALEENSDNRITVEQDCNELFKTCDIISLHCPLNKNTTHIIDEKALAKMKTSSILVNTSRGGLVDASALLQALKSNQIAGACLDVYEEEEHYFFEDHSSDVIQDDLLARLISMNQVLITSHQAFLTEEALANIAETTLDNIRSFGKNDFKEETFIVS